MIYAIRTRNKYVKFGRAKDVVRRLTSLQIGSPSKLQLMAVADWPDVEEARIHAYLSHWRGHGEWFRSCEAVDHVIALLVDPCGYGKWRSMVTNGVSDTPIPHRIAKLLRIK